MLAGTLVGFGWNNAIYQKWVQTEIKLYKDKEQRNEQEVLVLKEKIKEGDRSYNNVLKTMNKYRCATYEEIENLKNEVPKNSQNNDLLLKNENLQHQLTLKSLEEKLSSKEQELKTKESMMQESNQEINCLKKI